MVTLGKTGRSKKSRECKWLSIRSHVQFSSVSSLFHSLQFVLVHLQLTNHLSDTAAAVSKMEQLGTVGQKGWSLKPEYPRVEDHILGKDLVALTMTMILFTLLWSKGRTAKHGYVNTVEKQFKVKTIHTI